MPHLAEFVVLPSTTRRCGFGFARGPHGLETMVVRAFHVVDLAVVGFHHTRRRRRRTLHHPSSSRVASVAAAICLFFVMHSFSVSHHIFTTEHPIRYIAKHSLHRPTLTQPLLTQRHPDAFPNIISSLNGYVAKHSLHRPFIRFAIHSIAR